MNETETLADFYKSKRLDAPYQSQKAIGDFNVFAIEDTISPQGDVMIKYARRDFYKICLTTGKHLFHHADKTIKAEGISLLFFNPHTPYQWEALSKEYTGFFCIFKDAFFMEKLRGNLGELPMFTAGGNPYYNLNEQQEKHLSGIFRKMIDEVRSDYQYKQDLLVSYVTEMVHYALKIAPSAMLSLHSDARSRITALFRELLDRQFPVSPQEERFSLRSPKDFAEQLFLHVNYLNSAVKETTGKTTSQLIGERIALEARIMLKHTQWHVAEIGYALGFEDAAHFTNFFRKHTSLSPAKYRMAEVPRPD